MTGIKTSLVLPAEMIARLDEEARADGISRAEVIRRAILAYQDPVAPDRESVNPAPVLAERNRPAVRDRAILTAGAVLYLGLGIMAAAITRALRSGER